ncbi:MAG TPA: CBS and ACT domain-containing protein [Bacillota bacterium]|jgi:acetoin utilization protein AcuB|nr:CBS and ACT domain-containing protein [Bacillota bacterium]HOL08900.1 CBS and ACT domain-containing protein [Bacillota bacterium]HPO96593.1 CBS and ACT domain-containing protein [Bacillota bacterium]
MFVKDFMSTNLVVTTEDTTINEAGEQMRKNNLARLPVVRDGKLVGIITREDLLKVTPSAATTLSVWELNYVLSKLVVKDAMAKQLFTISPEATLEEAALLMRSNEVGALPVVDNGQLIGIITESDIFDAFLDLMGLKQTGVRLTVDLEDRIGAIADLTDIIKSKGVNIISLALFHHKSGELVLRLDGQNTAEVIRAIEENGYRIVHKATWD